MSVSISKRTAAAFALFAVFCAGTTGALLTSLSRGALENVIVDRQRFFAAQGAIAFLDDLQLATEELENVSRMVEVDLDDDDDAPERRVLNEAWRLTLFFFDGVVQIVDETGRCHGAEPEHDACVGQSFADADWFREAREADGPLVRFHSRTDRGSTIDLVLPMHDENGELEGVLRGEIVLARGDFFDESVRGGGPLPHQLVFFGPEGNVLFSEGDPALESEPWRAARRRLGDGRTDAQIIHLGGERLVLAWAPVGRTGAGLVYAWRWEDLDERASERARLFLLAALLVAAVGIALGFIVARWLTRPVLHLARDVARARAGEARIDGGHGVDEVGQLRRAFAELADTLEDRVQERTRELEETRDALVDAERLAALGRAGAALSHELRNSLNALSVGMDALGAGSEQGPVRQQVRGEIGRLRSLADKLLDFARPRELRRSPALTGELITISRELVDDFARDRDVRVDVIDESPSQPLEVETDLLLSVFTNLLRNAVEAASGMPEERRRVEMRARVEDAAWIVEVDDAGEGIDEWLRERLYDPFTSGRSGGVGLGLAVARRFVELHGGELELVDGALGGACFQVTLPLEAPPSDDPQELFPPRSEP